MSKRHYFIMMKRKKILQTYNGFIKIVFAGNEPKQGRNLYVDCYNGTY